MHKLQDQTECKYYLVSCLHCVNYDLIIVHCRRVFNINFCLDVPQAAQTTPSSAASPLSGLLISITMMYMYKHYFHFAKLSLFMFFNNMKNGCNEQI